MIRPLKSLLEFLRLVVSDDNKLPSSTRIVGIWIFMLLGFSVAGITTALVFKIFTLNDSASLKVVVDGVVKFGWIYMILAATALSLYGIHVWKYIAQLRSGAVFMGDPEDSDQMPRNPYMGGGMMGGGGLFGGGGMMGGGGMRPIQGGGIRPPLVPGTPVENIKAPIPPKTPSSVAGIGSDDGNF